MQARTFGLDRLRAFAGDKKGNVAMIFAASIVPIVVAVGASVDYGNALQTRTRMQAALDAAVIAGAKSYSATGSASAAEAAARNFYSKASDGNPAGTVDRFVISPDGYLMMSASSAVDTTFLGLAGIAEVGISADSKAAMSGKELELSIMLDITGSMANDMDELKDASVDLLDIVLRRVQKQRRIAIVPFSHAVNAGDYFDALTNHNGGDQDGDGWVDGIPNNRRDWCNRNLHKQHHWNWQQKCNPWRPVPVTNCVTERTGTVYNKDDAPGPNKYFPVFDQTKNSSQGEDMSSQGCLPSNSPIVPLTDNRTVLDDAIANLQHGGWTSGHLGTQFAWYMISPNFNAIWPAESQAGAYDDPKLLKVAILMTDGDYNTWYSTGNGNSWQQARALCTEMKAKGIEVYTIGFDMQAGSSTDTLQQCASSPAHYFFPYDGEALRQVFRDIGAKIAFAADGVTLAD